MHNIEAEQSLIGAALITPEVLDGLHALRSDHFFEPIHRVIFDEIRRRHDKGERVTPVLLQDALPPDLDIGGLPLKQYIARLCAEATTILNAPDYGRHVRRYAVARSFVAILQDLSKHRDDFFALDRALEVAFGAVDSLRLESEGRHITPGVSIGAATEAVLDYVTRRLQGEPSNAVPTGLVVLDRRMSGGLMPGHLIIGAGRPGSGKSTIGENIARATSALGFGAGFFSLEMPERDICVRFLSDQAFDHYHPITYNRILQGEIKPEEQQRLVEAQRAMRDLPLEIDTSAKLNVPEVGAKIRGMRQKLRAKGAELRLVVIDYLKYLVASDQYLGQMHYQIGEISGSLKQLAKEEEVAILLLCQLNREVEKREDKRPMLADLRSSADLEADADVVLFFYRAAYYLQNDPLTAHDPALQHKLQMVVNDLEINIGKQRMGPTGPLTVYCHMGCSAVRDMRTEDGPTLMDYGELR